MRRSTAPLRDIRADIDFIVRWAASPDSGVPEVGSIADIHAVGHRVVHGGERFTQSVLITDEVQRGIEDWNDLAPLHNPANIKDILAAREFSRTRCGTSPATAPPQDRNSSACDLRQSFCLGAVVAGKQ